MKLFRDIPRIVGTEAVNHFKSSFRLQGFYDGSLKRWQDRRPGAKRNKGRALLVNTGALRRSIRVTQQNADGVAVGSDLPYASAHNSGVRGIQSVRPHKRESTIKRKTWGSFTGAANKRKSETVSLAGARHNVRGFSRRMNTAKRQFVGNSEWLTRRIGVRFLKELRKTLSK